MPQTSYSDPHPLVLAKKPIFWYSISLAIFKLLFKAQLSLQGEVN